MPNYASMVRKVLVFTCSGQETWVGETRGVNLSFQLRCQISSDIWSKVDMKWVGLNHCSYTFCIKPLGQLFFAEYGATECDIL